MKDPVFCSICEKEIKDNEEIHTVKEGFFDHIICHECWKKRS